MFDVGEIVRGLWQEEQDLLHGAWMLSLPCPLGPPHMQVLANEPLVFSLKTYMGSGQGCYHKVIDGRLHRSLIFLASQGLVLPAGGYRCGRALQHGSVAGLSKVEVLVF